MKIIVVFGTRPEAIKLVPVIKHLKSQRDINTIVCVTAQHRSMLDQVLDFFDLKVDYDLNIMRYDQSLVDLTQAVIKGINDIVVIEKPDRIIVQGDTTTAFVAALAAFYNDVPIAHVEAGLRSHNKLSPRPEEVNRLLISNLADLHFAPTSLAANNLLKENISQDQILITGNTVIDALIMAEQILENNAELSAEIAKQFSFLDKKKKMILVTCHRRESFGKVGRDICQALLKIAQRDDVQLVFPMHPNPNINSIVKGELNNKNNIYLLEPVQYSHFVYLMKKSFLILTDSGGIQEEAPSLGKPVLVLREVTERQEVIEAGVAKLIGTNMSNIVMETCSLLDNENVYMEMKKKSNPYGDGKAAQRIVQHIKGT